MANNNDYYGPVPSGPPRKRQRQVKPVFVVDIRVPFKEIADFMNRVMEVEGFTVEEGRKKDPDGDFAHVGQAIVGFSRRGNMWRVEAATDALADKLCYLNRMPYNHTILRVQPDRDIPNNQCKYSCWNDYYFKRYGDNDNILDKEIIAHLAEANMEGDKLRDFLNEKMEFYGLDEFGNRPPIEHIRGMISLKSFVLSMGSAVEADRICFLNGIKVGHTTVTLLRSDDWIGPEPKFRSYLEFLRYRSDSNAEKRNQSRGYSKPRSPEMASGPRYSSSEPENRTSAQSSRLSRASSSKPGSPAMASGSRYHSSSLPQSRWAPRETPNSKSSQKRNPPPQPSSPEKQTRASAKAAFPKPTIDIGSDSDDEVQIIEEHEEAKKLEKENKHLRTVLKAMTHSNETKARDIDSLTSQLNELQNQVSNKESEVLTIQDAEANLKNEIVTTQEQVSNIHDGWQAQAGILVEQQEQINGIQQQLAKLNTDAKNVEASLLDERNECEELEAVLQRFASHPSSLIVVKKQQSKGETGEPGVAASDDAFDV